MKICTHLYHSSIETILSLYLSHTPEQRLYLHSIALPAITRHAVSYCNASLIITMGEWSCALLLHCVCMCGWFGEFQHFIRNVQLIAAAVIVEHALYVCSNRVCMQVVARFCVHFPQHGEQSLNICLAEEPSLLPSGENGRPPMVSSWPECQPKHGRLLVTHNPTPESLYYNRISLPPPTWWHSPRTIESPNTPLSAVQRWRRKWTWPSARSAHVPDAKRFTSREHKIQLAYCSPSLYSTMNPRTTESIPF